MAKIFTANLLTSSFNSLNTSPHYPRENRKMPGFPFLDIPRVGDYCKNNEISWNRFWDKTPRPGH